MEIISSDYREYNFENGPFDLICSFGSLGYISKEELKIMFERIMDNTNVKGYNFISIHEDAISEEEVRELYSRWQLISFNNFPNDLDGKTLLLIVVRKVRWLTRI